MKKKVEISLHSDFISVSLNDVFKNHRIVCEFISINIFQIALNKLLIENKSKKYNNITSTELRKINIHTLTKRCINLINSYINLDKETALKSMDFVYSTDIEYQEILKDVHKTALNSNRNIFLAKFSYVYIKTCLSYETNVSNILSNDTSYSKSYIKNLVKECFKKGFIKQSERGISGGVLTNKTISHLRQ